MNDIKRLKLSGWGEVAVSSESDSMLEAFQPVDTRGATAHSLATVDANRETIMWLMKRAFTLQRRSVETAMRDHGVTAAQAGVLTELLVQPGLSSSDLGRSLYITAQAATAAVATLENEGFIERWADPAHGRIRRCFLTKKGQRIAEACFPVAHEVEQKLLALFDDNQRQEFAELLRLYIGELPPDASHSGALSGQADV